MEFNLADLFESVATRVPDREAVTWHGTRLTFEGLDGRANRLAHGLESLGIGDEDHVGVFMYSRPEYLEIMVAAFKVRAVPINVNYRYVGEELAYLFRNAELRALVLEATFAPVVASIREQLPAAGAGHRGRRRVARVGALPDAMAYEEFLAANSPSAGFRPRSSDDGYIAYTGGTTGKPKGVLWRHEDIFFATMTPGRGCSRPEDVADNAVAPIHPRLLPLAEQGWPCPASSSPTHSDRSCTSAATGRRGAPC